MLPHHAPEPLRQKTRQVVDDEINELKESIIQRRRSDLSTLINDSSRNHTFFLKDRAQNHGSNDALKSKKTNTKYESHTLAKLNDLWHSYRTHAACLPIHEICLPASLHHQRNRETLARTISC